MARKTISENEFNKCFSLASGLGVSNSNNFKNREFNFEVVIKPTDRDLVFSNCLFNEKVSFRRGPMSIEKQEEVEEDESSFESFKKETNEFKINVTFENKCEFNKKLSFKKIVFFGKVRIHDCILKKVDFYNTSFNDLADFWRTEFNNSVIFLKTDFNSTAVFSMSTFNKNVLFTYSLFAGKAIFARTKVKKGFDVSQSVISGELQLFNLKFNFKEFEYVYIGDDDDAFQKHINKLAIIPLENKVHTFQILKKGFIDNGNYSDSILMQREEKKALRELIKEKAKDRNIEIDNLGDKLILCLNRWSNHYQSDFRNGILFTIAMVIIFGIPTLISTGAYLENICFSNCRFSGQRLTNGVKFFFNFLNPARSISYLDELKPFITAYLFDFLGRVAVGYGFYQTVQAFRKFK